MDGFKTLPKMAHFKTGGHAKSEDYCGGGKAMKAGGHAESEEMGEDLAQDKKLIKKAFKQHDESEHDKEPTEIKLKKGGRSKKENATVRKYKSGGTIENVYEAKKSSGDIDNIKKVKDIKPGKADASSKAAEKPAFKGSDVEKEKSKPAGHADSYIKSKESGKSADAPNKAATKPSRLGNKNAIDDIDGYKEGRSVKKMADGTLAGRLSDNVMGTPAQNAKAKEDIARYLRAKQMQEAAGKPMGTGEKMAMGLAGLGQGTPTPPAPTDTMGNVTGMPAQKRGGRAGKK
jgi:hypothetical protein